MEQQDERTVFYIEVGGSKAYIDYNTERHIAKLVGNVENITIPEEKLEDFIHTARLLGLKAGKI